MLISNILTNYYAMIIDREKLKASIAMEKYPKLCLPILELWVRHSLEAGNAGDLHELIESSWANAGEGGFDWDRTPWRSDFWWPTLVLGQDPSPRRLSELASYVDFRPFN